MNKDQKQLIKNIARSTKLQENTVKDLLMSGWEYVEQVDCTPRWQRHGLKANVRH